MQDNNEINKDILKDVIKFVEEQIKPIAQKLDYNDLFPDELLKPMIEKRFFGLHYPQEYGGSNYNSLTAYQALTEIAKGSAGLALLFLVHWMAVDVLIKFGTKKQKKLYLKDLVEGRKIAAYSLSEPQAGSDVSAIRTTAEKKEEGWLVNGTKYFCTNGGIADIYIIASKTKDEGNPGISLFIIEKGTPGFKIGPVLEKMGCRSSDTTSLILKDCLIPHENIIGEVNKGTRIAMYGLSQGRLGMSAMGLGIAKAAMEDALNYANKRIAFGKPIAKLYSIQEKIADMYIKIKSAQLLIADACNKRDCNSNYDTESSVSKIFVAEAVNSITNDALQIFGGHGYIKNNNIERYFRDGRLLDIGVGSSEVLKMVVGSSILKKNKEQNFS